LSAALHHPRVLVVDDDPLIRELVADALDDAGFAVQSAANGVEATERLQTWVPRAIVLDLMMPQLDGIGFCDRLHQDPLHATIPVLLLTAAYAPHPAAQRMGVQALLAKPFEVDQLIDMVARLAGPPALSPSYRRET
jgi:CheY-like chemotaxis protein